MSNLNFVSRTNSFRVKDQEAFTAELHEQDVLGMGDTTLISEDDGTFTLLFHDGEPELFPQDDTEPKDVKELISRHLPEGEVVVFVELANERMHSISAHGAVVNHKNERKDIDLIGSLFDIAESMGHVSGTLD